MARHDRPRAPLKPGPSRTPVVIAGIGALQALTLLVLLARGKLAAVTVGPEGVGILGVIEALVQSVAHLFSFGLPIAAVRFLSQAHSDGPSAFAAAYSRFLRRVVASGVLGLVVALGVVWLRPDVLGPALRPYRGLVLLSLLGAPFLPLRDLLANALAAARATGASAALSFWVAVGSTIGACAGIVVQSSVTGFLVGTLAGSGAALVVVALWLPRRLALPADEGAPPGSGDSALSSEIAVTSLVLWVSLLSYPLAQLVARHVVLARFGTAEAGLLQAGLGLSALPALLLGPATALYLAPAVNRRGPADAKGRIAASFLRDLTLASVLLALPLVLFPHLALRLPFAATFEGAAGSLALLVVGQTLRILAGVFYVFLVGLGDVKVYGVLVVVSQGLFGLLSWRLGSRDGVHGVALAFLVSGLFLLVATGARASWSHGLGLDGELAAFVASSIGVLLGAGVWCSARPSPSLRDGVGRLALGLAVAAGLALWGRRRASAAEAPS
jgi:O-antigen/teichoic acid export membrane protein